MKKILSSIFILLFSLCLIGCKNNKTYIVLQTKTHEVQYKIYENGCAKYNLGFSEESYYVINNYEDYLMFCSSALAMKINPNIDELKKFFDEFVIFCYARTVSYSREFIPVQYRYNKSTNEIKYFYTNKSSENNYPCVEVAYCFDMVDVPKDIYNKISKDSEIINAIYDVKKCYSMSPFYATQEYSTNNKKFSVEESIPGVVGKPLDNFLRIPRVIDLDSIKCDSLQELFKSQYSEQYLKENYKALWFIRLEPVTTNVLEEIEYNDLFIENKRVYVTINYKSQGVGGEAFSYYEDLILIPNEWEEKIGKSEINFNLKNHPYGNYTLIKMSYEKMIEFKNAYREQILNNKYDDMMYREIYMLDVYGEYNNCLVATVTYDGYVHTDEDWTLTDTFGDISISYSGYYPIWVCKDSKLYTLKAAYNNGYLTMDDIIKISKIN